MTEAEFRKTVLDMLGNVAPEANLATLPPEQDLREELDIDSMDFLNFAIVLHKRRGVDIPRPTIPRRELAG